MGRRVSKGKLRELREFYRSWLYPIFYQNDAGKLCMRYSGEVFKGLLPIGPTGPRSFANPMPVSYEINFTGA